MRYQQLPTSLLSVLACFFLGATTNAAAPYTLAARTAALQNSSFVPTSTSTGNVAIITDRPPPTNIPLSCYPPELQTTIPRWWGSDIADNTCTTAMSDGCPRWNPCNISVGTIQLLYWSTASNETWTQPTTLYDSAFDFTFTFPSIYMVYHAITAYNYCKGNSRAPIGPTLTSAIQDWALTDVSTMIPHIYPEQPGSMTDPRQFNPADLYNCTATPSAYTSSDIYGDPGPYATGHRCNPFISLSTRVRWLGEPYWRSCGIDNVASRAYDPPYVLQRPTVMAPFSNADPATTTIPTAVLDTTSALDPTPATASSPKSATDPPETVSVGPTVQNNIPTASANDLPSSSVVIPQQTTPTIAPPSPVVTPSQQTQQTPTAQENVPSQTANDNPTPQQEYPSPSLNTNTATPIVGGIITPQSSPLNSIPGSATSFASTQKQGQGSSENSASIPNVPNAGPGPSSTIQIVDAAQPITYLGATLAHSSPIATISSLNVVISYGSQGVAIQYPGGSVSTVAVQGPATPTSTTVLSLVSGAGKSATEGGNSVGGVAGAGLSVTAAGILPSSTADGRGPAAAIASVIYGVMNGGSAPNAAVTNTVSGTGGLAGVSSGGSRSITAATNPVSGTEEAVGGGNGGSRSSTALTKTASRTGPVAGVGNGGSTSIIAATNTVSGTEEAAGVGNSGSTSIIAVTNTVSNTGSVPGVSNGGTKAPATGTSTSIQTSTPSRPVVIANDSAKNKVGILWTFVGISYILVII